VQATVFGPDLIIGLLIVFLCWGVPIIAIVDAASRTSVSFRAAGSSKTFWIACLLIFMIFFAPVGIILAFVYMLNIRPRVRKYT
jgi:uncharacterized protein DUF2516